jgi:hypothetical protein
MIRVGLIISVILNALLVMAVLGIMPFFLYLLTLTTLVFAWFSSRLLSKTMEFESDIIELLESTSELQQHIETIHEMEMFYGDETLQALITHTREIVDEIDFYRAKYSEEDLEEDFEEELDMEFETINEEDTIAQESE